MISPELDPILGRILVGVDGTEAAYDACRRVSSLADPGAAVEALCVVHVGPAVGEAFEAARIVDVLRREAEAALERAASILGPQAQTRRADGFVASVLLDEIERIGAGLLALGSHGHRRATEILIGGVAGQLLHDAPCSVLIARAATEPFPRRILAGHDGSEPAAFALSVARRLAARHGAALRVVTALRGEGVDLERVRVDAPDAEELDAHPVAALVDAAAAADLVVLGSRGLHGLRALGSVSERVAHQAPCSVLVTRER